MVDRENGKFDPDCQCICLDFNANGVLTYSCFDAECSGGFAYLNISSTSFNGNACSCSTNAYELGCLGLCSQELDPPMNADSCIFDQDDEQTLMGSALLQPTPTACMESHCSSGAERQSKLGTYELLFLILPVSVIINTLYFSRGFHY
jgi:hypothetical protein